MSEAHEHSVEALNQAKAVQLAEIAPVVLDKPLRQMRAGVTPTSPHKYEYVGLELYGVFSEQTPANDFRHGGVEHGFRVCGRLAMWGLRAYEQYLADREATGSVAELGAILQASYTPAVTTFSSTNQDRNWILETAFGLTPERRTYYEKVPFVIASNEEDELVMAPSSDTLAEAEAIARRNVRTEPEAGFDPNAICPASGRMLRKVWARTVATCLVLPEIFPYDIARINAIIAQTRD